VGEDGAVVLRYRDLGPLLVERDGDPVRLGGGRLTSALSLLLLHAGRHVALDAVAAAMWGADERTRSSSTLDSHIWRLRKALEPTRGRGAPSRVLVHDAAGFRLLVEPDAVDSTRFARLADATRDHLADGRPDAALRTAEQALALWRGRPYADVADEPWAEATVARLQEVRAQLQERLVEALLGVGDPERAVLELETALAENPLRERLWALRMRAYQQAGRTEEALRAYQEVRRLLRDELGLEPGPELRALQGRILAGEVPPAPPPPAAPPPAPAPPPPAPVEVRLPPRRSRLVGRDGEVAELAALVRTRDLVTVVGAAGCGKTRLAIEVASRVADAFADGVWFVDLTAATDEESVVSAVASAVASAPAASERPRAALARALDGRRMLLVLDNCEHVLDPVALLVEDWLGGTAAPTVLATSREPLGVDGERVRLLDPLSLDATEGEDASTAPAVALLLDRLAAVGADPADLALRSDAVRIAAAVEGVPLALELAAARARAFSLEEIAHQVTADPSALSRIGRQGSDHHRTVRFAIDQSYAVLPPAEAALHRAVAVLPGPFTLAAARALVDPVDRAEVDDLLAWLVHRSLLVASGPARSGGPSRFAQLATIRGHATHVAEAELPDLRERRDAWVADLVAARPLLGHPEEIAWFDALDDDLAALRAALAHTLVDRPSPRGVALAARLGTYWYFRSKGIEGRTWFERTVAVGDAADPVSCVLARLGLAHFVAAAGRTDLAEPHIAAATGLIDETAAAESVAVAEALALLVNSLFVAGAFTRGREMTARVVAAAATTGDPHVGLLAEMCEVMEHGSGRSLDAGAAALEAVHTRAVEARNMHVALVVAGTAAVAAIRASDVERGLRWSQRMIVHRLASGLADAPIALELRGTVMAMAGEPREAVRLYAGSRAHAERNGLRWPAVDVTPALLARAEDALPDGEAERARAEGALLTLADVAATLDRSVAAAG
jgi:predicted ATPase/DNA-binding SARP family transcriptional activator